MSDTDSPRYEITSLLDGRIELRRNGMVMSYHRTWQEAEQAVRQIDAEVAHSGWSMPPMTEPMALDAKALEAARSAATTTYLKLKDNGNANVRPLMAAVDSAIIAYLDTLPPPAAGAGLEPYIDHGDDMPIVARAEHLYYVAVSAPTRTAAVDRIIGAIAHLYPPATPPATPAARAAVLEPSGVNDEIVKLVRDAFREGMDRADKPWEPGVTAWDQSKARITLNALISAASPPPCRPQGENLMPDLNDKVSEPCPFCGSVPVVETHPVHEGWSQTGRRIVCRNKDCFGPATGWYGDDEAMFAAWNRRTRRPAASTMEGWQTMDSAPKNRKVLVAYRSPLGNWRIVTACYCTQLPWSDDEQELHDEEYAPEGWYEESDSHEVILPTSSPPEYWQPLPAAPIPPEVSKP